MRRSSLAAALVASGALLGAPCPGAAAPTPPRPAIETPVERLARGLADHGLLAVRRWPEVRGLERHLGRAIVRADALLLELHADRPDVCRRWEERATRLGLQPLATGADSWLSWVPVSAIARLGELEGLARVRLPVPLRRRLGPVTSEGATSTTATAAQCHGQRGAGAQVAVIDEEWYGFSAALSQGELGEVVGKAPYQGSDPEAWHGTACAEIIADMAPAVAIRPLQLATLPELQAQLPKLLAAGVQVVSQSSGWTSGYSFGDGGGKACALVDEARQSGLAWVAAAGNEGGGHQWRGVWSDADQDGELDFASGDERNGFYAQGGTLVSLELDWNAYPATDIDLDLQVCAAQSGACQVLGASQSLQSGGQSPIEAIWWDVPKSGTFFLRVTAKQPPPKGLALRLVGQGTGPLQHHTLAGTVVDPAACAGAIAVGAAEVQQWWSDAIADYSARGPTFDGRPKPELLGPTAVAVAVTDEPFEGTSAAAPHVAGALALLVGGGLTPEQAREKLLAQADSHGLALPDNLRGHGWLNLGGGAVGCLPEHTDAAACTTSCGSAGQTACTAPCAAVSCVALGAPCPGAADADTQGSSDAAASADPGPAVSDTAPAATPSGAEPAHGSDGGCRGGPAPSGGALGGVWWIVALFVGRQLRRASQ